MPDREKVIKGIECHRKKVQTTNSISCLECPYSEPKPIGEWCMSGLMDDIYALLKEQKAVVRCKDCIYWDEECTEECDNSDSVCFHNGWCKPDWFCADGERKEGQ